MIAALHGHRVGRTVHPPQSPRSRRWWIARTRAGPSAWAATKRIAASTAWIRRRPSDSDELGALCQGITTSFVHLETRDAYGTEVEQPHMAKWRRGEPDDLEWLASWLEMLRGHQAAGRTCRRARIVSEPLSEYQRWINSHVELFVEAGEDVRYVARPRLTDVLLPGSGDFYVFDDTLVMFLHYAGNGTNTAFEVTDDSGTVSSCREAFQTVWERTTPFREYRPD